MAKLGGSRLGGGPDLPWTCAWVDEIVHCVYTHHCFADISDKRLSATFTSNSYGLKLIICKAPAPVMRPTKSVLDTHKISVYVPLMDTWRIKICTNRVFSNLEYALVLHFFRIVNIYM